MPGFPHVYFVCLCLPSCLLVKRHQWPTKYCSDSSNGQVQYAPAEMAESTEEKVHNCEL